MNKQTNVNFRAQNALTNELTPIIDRLEDKYHAQGQYWNHAHICTFEMLCYGNLKEAERKCCEYRAKNPIVFPKNWPKPHDISDYCDFCDMMNYVALDDKGRIMYVQRTNPEELLAWYRKLDKKKKL